MARQQTKTSRALQPVATAVPARVADTVTVPTSAVARRAYDLYLARGCEHGHDMDDWLQAERELQARLAVRLDQLADDGDPNVP